MTPGQLSSSGVLKPGASTLIERLIQSGQPISRAIPSSLFTGQNGINDLTSFISNPQSQSTALVSHMQQTQSAFGEIGMFTGGETATQIAGLVLAGTSSTNALLRNAIPTNTINLIGSGSFAAKFASTLVGIAGISSAIGALTPELSAVSILKETLLGSVATTYGAIQNGFVIANSNSPINLTTVAKTSAETVSALSDQTTQTTKALLINDSNIAGSTGSLFTQVLGSQTDASTIVNNSVVGIVGAQDLTATLLSPTDITSTIVGGIIGASGVPTNTAGVSAQLLSEITTPHNNINSSVNDITGMSGATANPITSGLQTLSSSAQVVQSGRGATLSSEIASGVNNLPGGINSTGTTINNNIDGLELLSAFINETYLEIMNGSETTLDVANEIGDQLNSMASKLATTLPAGTATQIQAAISALGTGSASSSKLPIFGINTTDRTLITAQTNDLLGPGIPKPNLVGSSDNPKATATINQIVNDSKAVFKAYDEFDKWSARIEAAKTNYYQLVNDLPAGDTRIAEALSVWDSLLNDPIYLKLVNQVEGNVKQPGSTVSSITSLINDSLTSQPTPNNNLGSAAGQGATAIQVLQDSTADDSLAGLIGPNNS